MSDFNSRYPGAVPAEDASLDAGLRGFMLGVYAKLGLGLALAGGLSYVVGNIRPVSELLFRYLGEQVVGFTPLGLAAAWAPVVLILFSNFFLNRMSAKLSGLLYWTVVALMGVSLGVLFVIYTGMAILSAFLVTAGAFAGLSLVGYIAKRSLSGMAAFLTMGMWGLFFASIATVFFPSLYADPVFFFAFNIIGVVVFGGLIAAKTQDLKLTYYAVRGDGESTAVATNYGALYLFISFVNLFRFILALMGGRRS